MARVNDSFHMSPDAFRAHGRAVVEFLAQYMERVAELPVGSSIAPGEIRAQLPPLPPQTGEPFEQMLGDVSRIVMPGLTHWQSPMFFGYFPCNNSGPSILGELLSAGLGVQGMLWSTSPACTELESHVLDWMANMLGLPQRFTMPAQNPAATGGGVIQDSASSATLCALLAGRERATGFAGNQSGIRQRLAVYASDQAHSSIEKAVMIAGIGRENLRLIPSSPARNFAMDVTALRAAIERDVQQGITPCFICATIGTTSSNAIDPLQDIGTIAKACPTIWLHVDAAMSGIACVCPEFRHIHAGLEHADSYCTNPHKWMFTNFDCDCFYVADRHALIRTLSVLPEYLKNQATASGAVVDYRDWQIPLGRRFRALKLWFVIRHYGIEGLQHHIREHIRLAQELAQWVRADDRFELVMDPPLNLVCLRHRAGDQMNQQILDRVNRSGDMFITHTRLQDRLTLRVSIGGAHTREEHVRRAWKLLQDAAGT
jgi:aromatic-L-amino-acid decarboxylase